MVVVSDTSPLNYLILIEHVDILRVLFSQVIVPLEVHEELSHPDAPEAVKTWLALIPDWYEVRKVVLHEQAKGIDRGEGAAIELARTLRAPVLIDDKRGRAFAVEQGVAVIGTLAILDRAARRGVLDYVDALHRLERTSFHLSKDHLNALIRSYMDEK